MKINDAIKQLSHMDKKLHKAFFSKKDLKIAFPDESLPALNKSINRLIKSNIIERITNGVYHYCYASTISGYPIEEVVLAMRPLDVQYVSLESALSEYGLISQIPMSRLTVMTTGRSGTYKTKRGVIEFTHTDRPLTSLLDRGIRVKNRPLPIATKEAALSDLKRVKRNLNMVSSPEGGPHE